MLQPWQRDSYLPEQQPPSFVPWGTQFYLVVSRLIALHVATWPLNVKRCQCPRDFSALIMHISTRCRQQRMQTRRTGEEGREEWAVQCSLAASLHEKLRRAGRCPVMLNLCKSLMPVHAPPPPPPTPSCRVSWVAKSDAHAPAC